jgi:small subunit ribosomal protein S1
VKGGYEVRVGRQRAFCPISHIDITRNTEPAQHEGRVYRFHIVEYREGGRNIVVSRRALLEDEQRATADEIRASIVEGAILTGRVASVREFGAFVDLGGGIQGLVHISEMRWERVSDPSQIVRPGDAITVKVLRVDDGKQRISLGLKQLLADPWSDIGQRYQPDQVRTGRVTRVQEFGAFVELEPGVEGFLPSNESGIGRGTDFKKAFPVGREIETVVTEVEESTRRIRVSVAAVQKMQEASEVRDYTDRAAAVPAKGFGSIGDKLRDALQKQ